VGAAVGGGGVAPARGTAAPARCGGTNAQFVWLISHQPALLFSQNKSATNNQPTVLFPQNKSAPAICHQPNEQAKGGDGPAAGVGAELAYAAFEFFYFLIFLI
jgi:hypothetical protein